MRVHVRVSGSFGSRLGSRWTAELEERATVGDLLGALAGEAGLDAGAAAALAVVAQGTILAHGHVLAEGDELDVLVPVAGG